MSLAMIRNLYLTRSASHWMQQALSSGYPRLLRLFHDFFAKIAVHTDTVYTREHQRWAEQRLTKLTAYNQSRGCTGVALGISL